MKKLFLLLSFLFAAISTQVSAQYTAIKLTAESDTTHLGDGKGGLTTRVYSFNYDAKSDAAFGQASMEAHHLNPFDLPEAEAELVSGYNVEYSAMGFALFFLAEYSNIILMAAVTALLFLGGWHAPIVSDSS